MLRRCEMRFGSKVVKISLILCLIAGFAIVSILWHRSSSEREWSAGVDMFLAEPAFAQEGEESFLDKEAGIAAYTNLGQGVNLAKAKTAFRIVEKETDTYVVGSVPVLGYEEETTEDVHCFVHKDGWIVAYYLRDEPTSKIMYWKNWDGKRISTKIEEGLASVSNIIMGTVVTDVKYYHFKYPSANRLMMIADRDSFNITVPGELVVHERTYSVTGRGLSIDGQVISGVGGFITLAQLKPDSSHTIQSMGLSWGNWYKSGNEVIILVYQEL
jgi:hypothetical protein